MWYKQTGTGRLRPLYRSYNSAEVKITVNMECKFGNRAFNSIYKVQRQVTKTLSVSWFCGNHCLFGFVLWCGCCSLPFQNFVWRHLVIAPIFKTKKSPNLFTVYESFFYFKARRKDQVQRSQMHNTKKSNKMIPCIHLHICNAKRFKPPKSLKDENNSKSLLKQHANIISLNKARSHGLSLHCHKRCHLVETLRSHMHRPAFSRRYPIIMEI